MASYRRFVDQGTDDETEKFYLKNHWPAVRGNEKFVDKAHLNSNAVSKEVSRERKVVEAEVILLHVCQVYGCNKNDLLKAKRGNGVDNTARAIAMKLCQEMGSMKLSEIGDLFGIGSDSGVTKAIGRLKERMTEDGSLTDVSNVLCQDMTP